MKLLLTIDGAASYDAALERAVELADQFYGSRQYTIGDVDGAEIDESNRMQDAAGRTVATDATFRVQFVAIA